MSGIIMASNTIILDNTSSSLDKTNRNNSRIAWDNAMLRATVTSDTDSANLPNLFDYMTTAFWNAGVGTKTVNIVLPEAEVINCAAIAAGNWASSGAIIEIYSDAGITKVGEVSGLKDGQPYYFDFPDTLITTMQIKFISTGDLFVGQAMMGRSLKLPVRAGVGLELGKFNNLDDVIGQVTENNALAANSTVKRNRKTVAPYSLIPTQWLNDEWLNFSDNHKGRAIWFNWDYVNAPNDTTFGHWQASNIKYTSSFFHSMTLTVEGNI